MLLLPQKRLAIYHRQYHSEKTFFVRPEAGLWQAAQSLESDNEAEEILFSHVQCSCVPFAYAHRIS
jgi:hypothetical protein